MLVALIIVFLQQVLPFAPAQVQRNWPIISNNPAIRRDISQRHPSFWVCIFQISIIINYNSTNGYFITVPEAI